MPGMFGIIGPVKDDVLKDKISRGVGELLSNQWHYKKTYQASRLGIAIAMRNKPMEGSDLWISPEEDLVVSVDGELYFGPSPETKKINDICEPTYCCADYIGTLFREKGSQWVEMVRGAFSVAVWDKIKQELWLFVDRYGLRPLCYSRIGTNFIFGSKMTSFTIAYPEIDWQLDWDAVSEWFTFQHVLGEKTFIENIKLLPNAGRLCYKVETGRLELNKYWTLDKIHSLPRITFKDAVEESCRLFNLAIREQTSVNTRLGVYLTSGLDSRTIAGYLSQCGLNFVTATYGITGCRDMVWGAELAHKLNELHFPFPMDEGSWIPQFANNFLKSSDFLVSCFCSHGINTYATMRDKMDVHICGIGGGSFAGADTTSKRILNMPPEKQWKYLYKTFIIIGNIFNSTEEQSSLFQPCVWKKLEDRSITSFRTILSHYFNLRPDIIGDAFILNNRYKKKFTYLIATERDYFENRLPFMDYRLLDFIFAIPTRLRLGRRLQIGMLDHAIPELTSVPWQVSARLPTYRKWMRWKHYLATRKNQYFKEKKDYRIPFEPGRNYPKWFRENCYDWAYDVLNSSITRDRGIFNHAYLLNLLKQSSEMDRLPYTNQRNLTFRIGAVLTFELMCRHVLDIQHK